MMDFEALRRRMVDNQVRPSAVTDHAVIEAFLAVPREPFVAEDEKPFAYADRPLKMAASANDRRAMDPASLARLVQALRGAGSGERALAVGCGSGYSAAILARLFREVVALEDDSSLAALARERLPSVGASNVSVIEGTLAAGHAGRAPYDAILIEGAVETLPAALLGQLAPGGLLAAVESDGRMSRAMLYERVGEGAARRPLFDAWATPVPGFERPREFAF